MKSFVNNAHLWWSIFIFRNFTADYRLSESSLHISFVTEKSFTHTLPFLAPCQQIKLRHVELFYICVPQAERSSCDPTALWMQPQRSWHSTHKPKVGKRAPDSRGTAVPWRWRGKKVAEPSVLLPSRSSGFNKQQFLTESEEEQKKSS